MEKLKELGSLFYVVNPYETMFEKVSDIPTPAVTRPCLSEKSRSDFRMQFTEKQ